jgi:hypothetical protein
MAKLVHVINQKNLKLHNGKISACKFNQKQRLKLQFLSRFNCTFDTSTSCTSIKKVNDIYKHINKNSEWNLYFLLEREVNGYEEEILSWFF